LKLTSWFSIDPGEAWLELQRKTGIEGLKRTTAHEPDYDKLMRYRIDLLRENNIKLKAAWC